MPSQQDKGKQPAPADGFSGSPVQMAPVPQSSCTTHGSVQKPSPVSSKSTVQSHAFSKPLPVHSPPPSEQGWPTKSSFPQPAKQGSDGSGRSRPQSSTSVRSPSTSASSTAAPQPVAVIETSRTDHDSHRARSPVGSLNLLRCTGPDRPPRPGSRGQRQCTSLRESARHDPSCC